MPDASYLDAAVAIGERLAGEALWSGARCNWLGDAMEFVDGDWHVVHRSCGVSLYDGTSGIALFLARLLAATGSNDPVLHATAEGALAQAASRLTSLPAPGRLGLHSGLVGVGYAFVECGAALEQPTWSEQGKAILDGLSRESDDGEGLDVISGAAGAIPALLRQGTGRCISLAQALGERLLARALRVGPTVAWNTMPGTRNPLTGYSHGTAGIAVALQELAEVTGDGRFAEAARGAVLYERQHFVAAQGNWPDFRDFTAVGVPPSDDAQVCATAWCHGAPGIALSRLRLWELTGDDGLRDEARTAIETTQRAIDQLLVQPGADCSVCHGLSGLAEPLLVASAAFDEPEYQHAARRVADRFVEWYGRTRSPWPCGVPGGGETPALMTGLSGIGHFFLRMSDPLRTPPVTLITASDKLATRSNLQSAARLQA